MFQLFAFICSNVECNSCMRKKKKQKKSEQYCSSISLVVGEYVNVLFNVVVLPAADVSHTQFCLDLRFSVRLLLGFFYPSLRYVLSLYRQIVRFWFGFSCERLIGFVLDSQLHFVISANAAKSCRRTNVQECLEENCGQQQLFFFFLVFICLVLEVLFLRTGKGRKLETDPPTLESQSVHEKIEGKE